MTTGFDHTHDLALRSFVVSANGHPDFPIQNLPLGIVSPAGGTPRAGIAIGDRILDLEALLAAGLLTGEAALAVETASGGVLNGLLALGTGPRRVLRKRVSALLSEDAPDHARVEACLLAAASCRVHLPARIGDYTDFYVGLHHATNVGRQFRPDNPLMPNYKWVPIGYHGRASSVVPSGAAIRRPNGQRKPATEAVPTFGPSRNLDYELELGIWIGPGNRQGDPIPIAAAQDHIAGFCLLNDWSARDIQGWEYQPLGPFLGKSFATSVSPWIVTPEAMAPFRTPQPPRPEGDPAPLPYLDDPADRQAGGLAVALEVRLMTPGLRAAGLPAHGLSVSDARHMYWTAAQLVTHHASNGCNLNPGDLFGTGTLSAPDPSGYGSLLETTNGGRAPITLASGETRRFLEDGDEIILSACCRREGFATIGFGECRGTIQPAHPAG